METDARGQLGGVDTTDMIRRRLAQESAPFRCQTCARTNAQIIAEAEERARQSSADAEDVQIPQELSMGWRDEMEASKKAKPGGGPVSEPSTSPPKHGDDGSESAELAEGFVSTGPGHPTPNQAPAAPRPSSQSTAPPPQRQRQAARPAHANNGVPLWIDRAIAALAVILAAMLFRIFLRM